MAANINDKITRVTNGSRPVPTTLISDLPAGASPGTANCGALTGWNDTTAMHFIIYNIDTNNRKVAGSQTDWKGIVVGGNLTQLELQAGSNTGYSVGAVVEAAPTGAWADELAEALLESHDTDGTLKDDVAMTTPKITTAIKDANGNEVLRIPATSAAVNDITTRNAATGVAPSIEASGDDTNIGIRVKPKGTGDASFGGNHSGWVYDDDTWVYVSASSFKITGKNVTARFPAGTKIMVDQSGDKFFYVTSSSFSTDTTVNVTAGSDYTLANATIATPRYSYEATPQGFPGYFNYTPVWQNVTLGSSTNTGRFTMRGKTVHAWYALTFGSGSSVSGSINGDFPVAANAAHTAGQSIGHALLNDNGIGNYWGPAIWVTSTQFTFYVANGSGDVRMTQANNGKPGTWNSGDSIFGEMTYLAA